MKKRTDILHRVDGFMGFVQPPLFRTNLDVSDTGSASILGLKDMEASTLFLPLDGDNVSKLISVYNSIVEDIHVWFEELCGKAAHQNTPVLMYVSTIQELAWSWVL
jgi:hypothetical protein